MPGCPTGQRLRDRGRNSCARSESSRRGATKPEVCPGPIAAALFEGGSIAFEVLADSVELAHPGHAAPTIEFNVVPAEKFILAVISPPRNVHVHPAHAIVVVWRHLLQLREISSGGGSYGISEVASHSAGRIRQAVGKQAGAGIEQQARGFTRAGPDHERLCVPPLLRSRGFVDVG